MKRKSKIFRLSLAAIVSLTFCLYSAELLDKPNEPKISVCNSENEEIELPPISPRPELY